MAWQKTANDPDLLLERLAAALDQARENVAESGERSTDGRDRPLARWVAAALPRTDTAAGGRELDARDLFRAVSPSVYVVFTFDTLDDLDTNKIAGQGSAVAVDERYVLTNCHVITGKQVIVLAQDKIILASRNRRR